MGPGPDQLPIAVRFARPGRLPEPRTLYGRVAVLDLAFDGAAPEQALRWLDQLGSRLAVWIDHHDQPLWEHLRGRPDMHLVPRSQAPACPPLVTAAIVASHGPVDTLVAHGDLDGVLSAAKWMLLAEGREAPGWLDPDGIAADTRKGVLTARGERLDRALRASTGRERLRRAVVASVLAEVRGEEEHAEVRTLLDRALAAHEGARRNADAARETAEPLHDLEQDVVLVDLRRFGAERRLDLTELMLPLQRRFDWVVVFAHGAQGRLKVVVSTDPARSGLDLRREFGLHGFAPFRVHVPAAVLLGRLPSARLREALGAEAG
ncbi:MAG TPA: hypothetical protein VGC54_12725 [Planctomycetota bacterium]